MGRERGVVSPRIVRGAAFAVTLVCILIAVVAALLAIWEFSGEDTAWRTVASCAIIGGSAVLLSVVNTLLGSTDT